MKSVRRIVSTLALTLAALSLVPSPASAQSARGKFTLPHDVRWQQCFVPAGDYEFVVEARGPSQLLTLKKLNGVRDGFMMLVSNVGPAREAGLNQILLVSRDGKSFVQTLELPKFGTTLNFTVPSASTEVALAGDHPEPTHLR